MVYPFLHKLDLFVPQNFRTFLGLLECLQSSEDPFAIYGFVFASQPSANERILVTVFSSRKTDAASVWAAGPTSTPADIVAEVLVVSVLVMLSINADES